MRLTPWFGLLTKPVRPGVYEVSRYAPGTASFDPAYSYFDGKKWAEFLWFKDCAGTPQQAYDGRDRNTGAGRQRMYWRGLAEEPKQ